MIRIFCPSLECSLRRYPPPSCDAGPAPAKIAWTGRLWRDRMLYEVASRRQANFSCCPQPPKTLAFMRGFFIRKKARGLQREFIQRQQDISDRKRREAQAQRTQTLQMLEALEES